jgi:hypothetical protein
MSMKSFTTRQAQVDFDVDGEMFFLRPGIAAGQMFEVSSLQGKMQASADDPDSNAGKVLMEELATIFEPDSFERFEKRFWGKDRDGNPVAMPVDLQTFNEIIEWVFGEALGKGLTQK